MLRKFNQSGVAFKIKICPKVSIASNCTIVMLKDGISFSQEHVWSHKYFETCNSFRNETTSQLLIKNPIPSVPENESLFPKIICPGRFSTKIILILRSASFRFLCSHEQQHSIMMLMSLTWLTRPKYSQQEVQKNDRQLFTRHPKLSHVASFLFLSTKKTFLLKVYDAGNDFLPFFFSRASNSSQRFFFANLLQWLSFFMMCTSTKQPKNCAFLLAWRHFLSVCDFKMPKKFTWR